jgi:hypothetical protein
MRDIQLRTTASKRLKPVRSRTFEVKQERKQISVSGTVTAVFARRFVVEDKDGKHLADMGKKAVDLVTLHEGDKVTITGRCKAAEIKVAKIIKGPGETIRIERKDKPDRKKDLGKQPVHHDPRQAIAAVTFEGFTVLGEPIDRSKHFEILGRSAKGKFVEFHVERDGAIDKQKPAHIHAPKWASAISEI